MSRFDTFNEDEQRAIANGLRAEIAGLDITYGIDPQQPLADAKERVRTVADALLGEVVPQLTDRQKQYRSIRDAAAMFVVASPNGLVLTTITNVQICDDGRVAFDRLGPVVGDTGTMTERELLTSFLEGRAFRLGEQS